MMHMAHPADMFAAPPLPRQVQELLDILIDCAVAGEVCPSQVTLADRLDASESTINSLFARLKREGYIAWEVANHARLVTILASGKQTAAPDKGHFASRKREYVRDVEPSAPIVRVARDPCTGCGVPEDRHEVSGCKRFRWQQ